MLGSASRKCYSQNECHVIGEPPQSSMRCRYGSRSPLQTKPFACVVEFSAGGGMFASAFAIAFLAGAGVLAASARTVSTVASTAAVGFLDLLNVRDIAHCLSPFDFAL